MSHARKHTERPLDLLRLSTAELEQLEQWLNTVPSDGKGIEFRKAGRIGLENRWIAVALTSITDEAPRCFTVRPRDISASGFSFLHGSFVHPGSECLAGFKTLQGPPVMIAGQVVRCRHLSGRVHEVGVKARTPIDLEQIVPVDKLHTSASSPAEPLTPASMPGQGPSKPGPQTPIASPAAPRQ